MEAKKSFVFGPYRLDLANERLWRENDEIRLTPKAYGVLAHLVEHSDRLVTKGSLLDTLWPDVHVTEAALTVCITELRKALADNAKEPQFIETVHRRGYRFIAPVTIGAEQIPTQKSEPSHEVRTPGDSPAPHPPISAIGLSLENAPTSSERAFPRTSTVGSFWRKAGLVTAAVLLVGLAVTLGWNVYRRAPLVGEGVTSNGDTVLSIPEKPSIAVLPFENLSRDPKQEYFSDGISDNIITQLAKIPDMFVIARNSSFTYKDKPVKVQQVGQELGVRYVLEGSVQKAGGHIRINAQLIDAPNGRHLWAESYDRELKDVFVIQDDITLKIVKSLLVKLTHGESYRVTTDATKNVKAWEASLQGLYHFRFQTKESNARARQLYQKALELDPEFAFMYASIGTTHLADWRRRWSKDRAGSLKRAEELAQKALAKDDSIPEAHALLSWIYLSKKQYEKALAAIERSVTLAPNDPRVGSAYAHKLLAVGRYEEAVEEIEKAIRLDPYFRPTTIRRRLGRVYYAAGRYDEAIAACKKYLEHDPKRLPPLTFLVASLVAVGREEEARVEADKILEYYPKFSAKARSTRGPYRSVKNPELKERLFNHLRQAGLPE